MKRFVAIAFAIFVLGMIDTPNTSAQFVVIGSPAVVPIAPVVSYRPVIVPPIPVPPVAVTSYRVSVTQPVTTYTRYTVARPAYYAAPVPVVPVAPVAPYVVRPKYYIPGRPILNTVRAFTP